MPGLRHCLTSIGVALLLGACSREAAPPAVPAAKPVPVAPRPAPKPLSVRVAPEWQSRLPALSLEQVDETMRRATEALARGQLERGTSPGPGALELYLAVLAVDPANVDAQVGVQYVLDAMMERGRLAMRAGRIDDAARIETITLSLLPEHRDLPHYTQQLAAARKARALVDRADAAGQAGNITAPGDASVLALLAQANAAFPDFYPAGSRRGHWNLQLLDQAWRAARANDFATADARLLESARLSPGSASARVMALRIIELRQERTQAALEEGNREVDRLRLDRAEASLARAGRIAAQASGVDALRQRIFLARHYGPFKPGEVFQERLRRGGTAPEMVVIPFGRFLMGSPDDDRLSQASEKPAHTVRFARGFAIGRNEVTVAQFKRFVDATGYRTRATRAGGSTVYDEKGGVFSVHAGVDWRSDHVGRVASPGLPVVHIALEDAQAYARWLSAQTGKRYRLPSEAEFEYVLRAGSASAFPWGTSAPRRVVGNLTGDGDLSRVGRRWSNAIPKYRDAFWGPAPVRSFPAERFGTFDMIGNVSEWTQDCWHDSYQRAPMNGSAWVNPGCPKQVARGASWSSALDQARSASRLAVDPGETTARLGFRIVREL